jgi:hypothetical protein
MEKGDWGFKESFKMVHERNRGKTIFSLRKKYGSITHVVKELGGTCCTFCRCLYEVDTYLANVMQLREEVLKFMLVKFN